MNAGQKYCKMLPYVFLRVVVLHRFYCTYGIYANGKYSKVSNTFLFSNKMSVIKAGIHKMLVRISNSEDPG